MATQKSLYDLLGLSSSASGDEIGARADAMLLKLQDSPLTADTSNQQKFVLYARETLCDPNKRVKYDRSLRDRAAAQLSRDRADGATSASASGSQSWLILGLGALLACGAAAYLVTRSEPPAQPSVANVARSNAAAATSPNTTNAVPSAKVDASAAAKGAELAPTDIFAMNQNSVVIVKGGTDSQGSGVVISSDEVITNCHVAAKARDISVIVGAKELPARIRYRDLGHDLCQLIAPAT